MRGHAADAEEQRLCLGIGHAVVIDWIVATFHATYRPHKAVRNLTSIHRSLLNKCCCCNLNLTSFHHGG